MDDSPIFRIVLQRHVGDCAAASLGMLLGVSYERALMALAPDCPGVLTRGVWGKDLPPAAERLGYRLRRRRRYDIETDFGILIVKSAKSNDWRHMVILRRGEIADPDGSIWEVETFVRHYRAELGPLFVVVEN